MLIPNQFTPRQPWGEDPQQQWNEREDHLGLRYPYNLFSNHDDCTTHIPIYSVSHITHNKGAEGISSTQSQGHYTFKPSIKRGKQDIRESYKYQDTIGISLGETYKQLQSGIYQKIEPLEPVFPGYLSWWGINITPFYETKEGSKLQHKIGELYYARKMYVPGYLRDPSNSYYGNKSFSISFHDFLTHYKEARRDKQGSLIQIKVGGTLLYENEICYVAIIGLEGDSDLDSMLPAGEHKHCRVFKHNGLLDPKGTVSNFDVTPIFRAAFIISRVDDLDFCWEQLVFALYFPHAEQRLTLSMNSVTVESVKHDFCIRKQPPPGGGKWECPNEIESQAKYKRV